MTHGNSNAHCFSEFYTSQHYQADLLKFKEDLENAIKSKLGVDMGTIRLYQKPYPAEFDLLLFLLVGVFLSLLNLMVMILVRLGNTLVNMSCSWEKPVSMTLCECVYFLYL